MTAENIEKPPSKPKFNADCSTRFIAQKTVTSMAIGRQSVCIPGDEVVVEGWYCERGPTVIKVNGRSDCVPFSWVIEMGAPSDLEGKMQQI